MCNRKARSTSSTVESRCSRVPRYWFAYSATVVRPAAGSTYCPRFTEARTSASNRSAAARFSNSFSRPGRHHRLSGPATVSRGRAAGSAAARRRHHGGWRTRGTGRRRGFKAASGTSSEH
jgi:hypothetical protein